MAGRTISIDGSKETIAALRSLPASMSGNKGGPVKYALFKAAAFIKKISIANAPVGKGTPRPGLLRKSIYVYRDRNPKSSGASEKYYVAVRSSRKKGRGKIFGAITAGAYYWHMVEFGTVKMDPRKYLTRAFATAGAKSVVIFETSLRKGVEKLRRKVSIRG